jgi:hypothetical protein
VVLLKGGETLDGADAKVNNNGIRILLGEITEPAKHLRHDLAVGGLRGIVLEGSRILGVFDGLPVLILHLGVLVLLSLASAIVIVAR